MMTVIDGCLPSNAGGGSNIRNILRRVFAIIENNGWWEKDKLGGIEGLLEFMEQHKKDLEGIFGQFKEYKSFGSIITMEFDRYKHTDSEQKKTLEKLLKKQKGELTIDNWITAMQSWGIPADTISKIAGLPIPNNLYYVIAERQERITKAAEVILYDTIHLEETKSLYFENHHLYEFQGKVTDVFLNIQDSNKKNIVILNQSAFYPTSGGQMNDLGTLTIEGELYNVVNCEKVGKSVLHILDHELPLDKEHYIGKEVSGTIDKARRS